ncbi:MAG: glucose-6-phosphate isomerase [Gammaproteobacteria bacterium]|nr:glucose-6-phosphate isomerase [Gammaproteobacteria bacterium]
MTDSTAPGSAAAGLMAWGRLAGLANQAPRTQLATLLRDGPRCRALRCAAVGTLFDFSRQPVDGEVLQALLQLAGERQWEARREALFAGEPVNTTEGVPALHTALRAPAAEQPEAAAQAVPVTRQRLMAFAESVRDGRRTGHSGRAFQRVVHIGIGGSQLGPELAIEALRNADCPLTFRFVANIDGHAIADALVGADPETTLFIVVSKSFTTLETLANAATARNWLLERTNRREAVAAQFVAVTARPEAATAWGLRSENIFPMWDWVGGRFSLWSAVGAPVAIGIGKADFKALLDGAHAMDRHFREAPAEANAPLLAALTDIWNINFLGVANHAVLPYDHRLRRLPAYLQQLMTESNGKSTRHDGSATGVHTAPVIWGGEGTTGQHAFHQMLHQGTRAFSADFILTAADGHQPPRPELADHHRWLLANGLGQGQAMALGWPHEDAHRAAPGNHGTNTIVLDRLDAKRLGALLAFYEHRVFCQGLIWDINSFDQWGVEFGKQLARTLFDQLGRKGAPADAALGLDAATQALVAHLREINASAAAQTTAKGERR